MAEKAEQAVDENHPIECKQGLKHLYIMNSMTIPLFKEII